MTTPRKSFGERMITRMSAAYKRYEEMEAAISQAVPVLEQAVAGNKDQIEALSQVLQSLKSYSEMFEAATGHLKESDAEALRYEMAGLTSFIGAMDLYFSTEPKTVLSALEKFDPPVLQEALEKLEHERFVQIEEIVQKARANRYKKSRKKELRRGDGSEKAGK